MIEIEIANRVQAAFGFMPKIGTIRGEMAVALADAVAKGATSLVHTAYLRNTKLADVYVADTQFANLTLRNSDSGENYVFDGGVMNATYGEILAPPPMMSFSRQKKIVTTTIDGSDSQVVESFGLSPYEITLSGILVDKSEHHYPSSQVQKFIELFSANVIYDVLDCQLMADLGIESLYFTKLDKVEVLVDYQDTVKYVLKAMSIKPIEFFI